MAFSPGLCLPMPGHLFSFLRGCGKERGFLSWRRCLLLICAVIGTILILTQFLCLPLTPPCRAYDRCWVGLSLSILFLLVIWKRNLAADLFYYFYYYFFAFASILSQCSTNVVYKQQLMHLLLFFSSKMHPDLGEQKNKIQQQI